MFDLKLNTNLNLLQENLNLLQEEFCYIVDPGQIFTISETKTNGKGSCSFQSEHKILVIQAKNKNSTIWALKNQKCAEASFLEFTKNGQKILHILEMKMTCNLKTFNKVCLQLEGMYYSSLAIMQILKIGQPDEVISYIAYKYSKMTQNDYPMIANKLSSEEKKKIFPHISFWEEGKIKFHNIDSKLVKLARDENGDCPCLKI